MPSPFYNTSGAVGLRKLLGTSKVHDIGVGFQALGDDIEELLALGIYNEVKHTANCTANAGEFLLMEASGAVKVILPVGSRNIMVGLHNTGSANVKIEPQAGEIYSVGAEGKASVELTPLNYLVLLSVPTRGWFVLGGQIKSESKYAAEVEVEVKNPSKIIKLTPSASRPSILSARSNSASPIFVKIEGVIVGRAGAEGAGTAVAWIEPGVTAEITTEPSATSKAIYTLITL